MILLYTETSTNVELTVVKKNNKKPQNKSVSNFSNGPRFYPIYIHVYMVNKFICCMFTDKFDKMYRFLKNCLLVGRLKIKDLTKIFNIDVYVAVL